MAATQIPAGTDGADTSLDRLEAALEIIARGLVSSQPTQQPANIQAPADTAALNEVEQRIDAVIEHVKTALGRKSDQ